MTTKPFPVSPEYTAPKNSMIIPAFWNSLHDETCYPEPDRFLPERWLPQADGSAPIADSKPQNYLVWGSGPHKCIGGQYASMHLAATLGTASVLMDWKHERTELSDEVQVIAAYVFFSPLFRKGFKADLVLFFVLFFIVSSPRTTVCLNSPLELPLHKLLQAVYYGDKGSNEVFSNV